MGLWDKARESWETGRQIVERLTEVGDHVKAAANTATAASDAADRSKNPPLILSAEQALEAMRIRHGSRYPRTQASQMTKDEIEAAQWELVEAWKAFRRLTLITNAIQWALNKMIHGKPPIPSAIEMLNALEALFKATGDTPTRSDVMEFWAKYCSGQLNVADQVARGLTETGKMWNGGSLSDPTKRKQLEDILADDGTSR